MTPTQFLDSVSSLELADTFNPYRHRCAIFDVEAAPSIRLENLRNVLLSALQEKVDIIWIARDLGYRGGRRTGLALTDEAHLAHHARLYNDIRLSRSTQGPVMVERTATIIWNMLDQLNRPVFLWNVFPFHPYDRSNSHSNRCHTRAEANACSHLLTWLLERLNPTTVVALGLEAQSTLDRMEVPHVKARHPSYGGKSEFELTIRHTFNLKSKEHAEHNASLPF